MKTGFFTDEDVELLRDVAYILSTGRVGDMVHDSFPERVQGLADRLDPQRAIKTRFGVKEA